jgi:hypothetical protein
MASENAFDIVSKVDMQELANAITQAEREIETRFDFKGSKSSIKLEKDELVVASDDDYKLKSVIDILQSKMMKRGVPIKNLDYGKIEGHQAEIGDRAGCRQKNQYSDPRLQAEGQKPNSRRSDQSFRQKPRRFAGGNEAAERSRSSGRSSVYELSFLRAVKLRFACMTETELFRLPCCCFDSRFWLYYTWLD